LTRGARAGQGNPSKVLFLSATPLGTATIDAVTEQRTIRECLQGSGILLDVVPAASFWDLPSALLGDRPAIIHFSGHGLDRPLPRRRGAAPRGSLSPDAGAREGPAILMHGEGGVATPIGTALLSDTFKVWSGTRCVVLNACFTEAHERLAEHVECVIGTTAAITDDDAIAFSKGFYAALAQGQSIATAFAAGRIAIEGIARGDPAIVRLIHRSRVRPEAIRLTTGAPPPAPSMPILSALIFVAFLAACALVALFARS
jgi:hypothetical protein